MSFRFFSSRWLAGLLVLPIGATAALSWSLQRDAAALTSSLADLRREHARLRAETTAAEQRYETLQQELAAAKAAHVAAEQAAAARATALRNATPARPLPHVAPAAAVGGASPAFRSASGAAPSPSGPHGNVYFPELFADPPYARLYLTLVRHHSASRYAPLFAELAPSLPPAELARFKETLAVREMALEEVDGVLETQAMAEKRNVDRAQAQRIKGDVRRTFDQEIVQNFGADVRARLLAFENNTGARQLFLDRLTRRLSYSSPLTDAQAASLAELYRSSRGLESPPGLLGDKFLASAAAVLEPAQMSGLREIDQEMRASQIAASRIRSSGPPPAAPR